MFGLTGLYLKLAEFTVLIVFLFGVYYWVGYQAVEHYKEDQVLVQAKADAAKQAQYDKLAGDYEALKTKRATTTNTITRQVETVVKQPIYQTSCIDQKGLDIANKSLGGSLE